MAGVIHHGSPGSYKSSGVQQQQVIKALKSGRTLVTNVRGLNSLKNIEKAFSLSFPEETKILYIDTKGKQAKHDMACWFHWAPKGALILIDEAQMIYPSKRKDFKLENLDYLGGADQAAIDNRPADFMEAFDMHRHHNWDIFLCTTNIAKIHPEIRQVCDVAYRHYSLGNLIPWKKGKWREVEHDPENSGKAASHAYGSPKEYKIDPRIFECYESTTTGEYQQTQTSSAFYKDKRVIAIFAVFGLALCGFIYNVAKIYDRESSRGQVVEMAITEGIENNANDDNDGDVLRGHTSSTEIHGDVNHPFKDVLLSISASYFSEYRDNKSAYSDFEYQFYAVDTKGKFSISSDELLDMGYQIISGSRCHAEIFFDDSFVSHVYCHRSYIDETDSSTQSLLANSFQPITVGTLAEP